MAFEKPCPTDLILWGPKKLFLNFGFEKNNKLAKVWENLYHVDSIRDLTGSIPYSFSERWQLKYFLLSPRKIGEDSNPFLTSISVQMGWLKPPTSFELYTTKLGFFEGDFFKWQITIKPLLGIRFFFIFSTHRNMQISKQISSLMFFSGEFTAEKWLVGRRSFPILLWVKRSQTSGTNC